MALTGDTGNGASLTLPGGLALAIIDIEPGAETLPMIDSSVLATTGVEEMIPGDLSKIGEYGCKFKWVSTLAKPTLGTVGTCTVTWPLAGTTTAANYSGTGCITSWKPPAMQNGVMQVGEVKFQFDGDTGPAYTVAS